MNRLRKVIDDNQNEKFDDEPRKMTKVNDFEYLVYQTF